MSDQFRGLMYNLDGDIVLGSLILVNTTGAFCDLFTAAHPTAGKLALKRPRGDCYDKSLIHKIEIEASVWTMLRHPRILQFLGIYKTGDKIYLVSPFAENGSLPGFLSVRPDVHRRRLVIEIAEGLAYLHQCGIIHGDLKGNNVLVSNDEHILLCDFGLAKHVTSRTSTSLRGVGSIPWQSPELLRDASRRTFQGDVYAFGITIYEVLSGKEPYLDHSGIGSIIAGVLLSAERPPKEPLSGPDGTSYLQLWQEASKCWDEDPALRPPIIGVLARLDHERAQEWITAQQIALETSLDPSVDVEPNNGLATAAKVLDNTTETLRWARSITSRLATFMNSKQPILRMTSNVLAAIILQDDTELELSLGHPLQSSGPFTFEGQKLKSNISRMFRSMQLRQVSRAWRDAIDTSTQLCSFVWVGNDHNNVEYIRGANPNGPLECVISEFQPNSHLSILEPIAHRISRIAIVSISHDTAEALEPSAFPGLIELYYGSMTPKILPYRSFISRNIVTNSTMALVLEKVELHPFELSAFEFLHTITITQSVVRHTFIADFLAMLATCPNVDELVLEHLSFADGLSQSLSSRVTHRGLQRMRLYQIPAPMMLALLLNLEAENLSTLVVYELDGSQLEPSQLSQLSSPEFAFSKTIQSLLRANSSSTSTSEMWFVSGENSLMLRWPSITRALRDKWTVDATPENWDFNKFRIINLRNVDVAKLIHVLSEVGIKVEGVTLDNSSPRQPGRSIYPSIRLLLSESQWWFEILTRLQDVRKMAIGVGLLDEVVKHLSKPIPGIKGGPQYLCPHLTHLEVWSQFIAERKLVYTASFREHIRLRQRAGASVYGPRRLEKIGVPAAWIDQVKGNDLMLNGVAVYSTDSWDQSVRSPMYPFGSVPSAGHSEATYSQAVCTSENEEPDMSEYVLL
ncbi:hypothetical protein FS837_008772 [Tulasnella sp. UAMH 9824]|nr:hypothetical protein FS837_008772 [Tulasnella sp. UAMH 9824]